MPRSRNKAELLPADNPCNFSIPQFDKYDADAELLDSYIERFECYADAYDLPEDKSKAIFLTCLGPSAYSQLRKWTYPAKPRDLSYRKLVEALKEHLLPKTTQMMERYRFRNRKQQQGEPFSEFLADIKSIAMNCGFKGAKRLEEELRDQITYGVLNRGTQAYLLQQPDLTLTQAIIKAHLDEQVAIASNCLQGQLSFYNWDLNDSSTNGLSVTDNVAQLAEGDEDTNRPMKYSSRYSTGRKDRRRGNVKFGDRITGDKDALQNEGNEHIEVFKEPKKEALHEAGSDNAPAETGHKSKGENKKHSEGSGEEHHEDHHDKKESKGLKEYKGEHHYHKGEKGHHDKEGHKGQYSDKKGSKKAHKEGGGHFEAGVHGEKGQKETKHSDKEEYKKGHSTRGGHVVHKKDEYEKKHEFYDEHHEGGEGEKHGEYFEEHHAKNGGHKKGGHKHGDASGHHKGKKGHYEKGHKFHEQKGHKKAGGHDKKHEHDEKYGKKEGDSHWKKFEYDKGKGHDSGGGHSHVQPIRHAIPASHIKPPQGLDKKSVEIKPEYEKFLEEETKNLHRLQLAAAATAQAMGNQQIPSTKLTPPPMATPKITISRFKFPPIEKYN